MSLPSKRDESQSQCRSQCGGEVQYHAPLAALANGLLQSAPNEQSASPATGSRQHGSMRVPGPPCGTEGSPASGPTRSVGGGGATGQAEEECGSLRAERPSERALLVERGCGGTREARRVSSVRTWSNCLWCGRRALQVAGGEVPDQQQDVAHLRCQVGLLQRETDELTRFMREMRVDIERRLARLEGDRAENERRLALLEEESERRLTELEGERERHQVELAQLRQLVEKALDAAQQQQTGDLGPSVRRTQSGSRWTSWWRPKKLASRMAVDGPSPCSTLSTVSWDALARPPAERPALVWEVSAVVSKIDGRQELWSRYFRPPASVGGTGSESCGRHTMRLWLRLNEAVSRDRVPVELLVWRRDGVAPSPLLFEGRVTVTIRDKLRPLACRSISSQCRLLKPDYSRLFEFRLTDLEDAGVLKHDVISVECVVLAA